MEVDLGVTKTGKGHPEFTVFTGIAAITLSCRFTETLNRLQGNSLVISPVDDDTQLKGYSA